MPNSNTSSAITSNAESVTVSLDIARSMLTHFDGNNKSKLYEFIDNCDEAYSLVSEINKVILLKIIKTKLTDNARLLIKNRNFNSWSDLRKHLLDSYSERRTGGQWQLELNSCKQNHKESVLSYSNRIENCYVKLLNTVDDNLSDEGRQACVNLLKNQALNAFIAGLNRELLILVKSQKPENLEEAIAIACNEEEEMLSKNEIQKFQNINNATTKHCHYCNKAGHSSFNCFSRNKHRHGDTNVRHFQQTNFPKSNQYQSKQNANHYNNSSKNSSINNSLQHPNSNYTNPQKMSIKQCNYCKNFGHTIFECRKRQYNNQRRNTQNPVPSNSTSNHLNSHRPTLPAEPRTTNHIQAELL